VAGSSPLLLLVEDLHWADQTTRDLLAFLWRNLAREPILLVISYRNDEPSSDRLRPSPASWPSSGSPGAARRPRSPTGSASTSGDATRAS
jgi:predicted ATPase